MPKLDPAAASAAVADGEEQASTSADANAGASTDASTSTKTEDVAGDAKDGSVEAEKAMGESGSVAGMDDVALPWVGMQHCSEDSAKGYGAVPRYGERGAPVVGRWGPALEACDLVFCWDNSHSRMRSKTITFDIKVVQEYESLPPPASTPNSRPASPP